MKKQYYMKVISLPFVDDSGNNNITEWNESEWTLIRIYTYRQLLR